MAWKLVERMLKSGLQSLHRLVWQSSGMKIGLNSKQRHAKMGCSWREAA